MEGNEKSRCIQGKWNDIVNSFLDAASNVVGRKNRTKKIGHENTIALSKKQKQLREELNNTKDETGRRVLENRRNKVLQEIHKELKEQEIQEITEIVENIEKYKEESR